MFLFTMFFNLLMLPFTLLGMGVRILFGLLGISTSILLWPLKIFARHTLLCLAVFALFLLFLFLKKEPDPLSQLTPAPATKQENLSGPNGQPIIQAVRTIEDGDSSFATDLYATMANEERAYYSQIFFWGMTHLPDGQSHSWNNLNIAGTLRPTDSFTNKSGVRCRHFTEVLKVHDVQQTLSGTACAQPGGTWCKLKPNATPACNLGGKRGFLDGALGGLF